MILAKQVRFMCFSNLKVNIKCQEIERLQQQLKEQEEQSAAREKRILEEKRIFIGALALQSGEVSNCLALYLNHQRLNKCGHVYLFQTREIKEKLQELITADDKTAAMKKELEAEHEVLTREVAKLYTSEKEKLQDTIEALEIELRVS